MVNLQDSKIWIDRLKMYVVPLSTAEQAVREVTELTEAQINNTSTLLEESINRLEDLMKNINNLEEDED